MREDELRMLINLAMGAVDVEKRCSVLENKIDLAMRNCQTLTALVNLLLEGKANAINCERQEGNESNA